MRLFALVPQALHEQAEVYNPVFVQECQNEVFGSWDFAQIQESKGDKKISRT